MEIQVHLVLLLKRTLTQWSPSLQMAIPIVVRLIHDSR